ncbi:integrase catalytic domain-containing protein [Trichonephila clavata]|uniref:Integrase catalytic domain-containing protein n=1 Tax=Trichonephila clavata TaxID=2740835 RepID=A0A8X6M3B1_TRICU|nr:integrase catalytic domain-containing protein [Trichonephila clavata]
MELMACVLGVRLSKYVTQALTLDDIPKYFWTYSTTAISWIRSNDAWGNFVGNRVKEICAFSRVDQWSYVPGSSNPVDLPSYGCSLLQFSESGWWRGPDWLKDPGDRWPKLEIKPDEILVLLERKKGINLNVGLGVTAEIDKVKWCEKFSEFSKMVRILDWVKRFTKNCQKKVVNQKPFLSVDEVRDSSGALLLLIQAESFPEIGDSISGLLTVRDQSGLRRVKTKIIEREDSYAFRYPVLLPSTHYIVNCLIRDYHLRYYHAGIQELTVIIREEF